MDFKNHSSCNTQTIITFTDLISILNVNITNIIIDYYIPNNYHYIHNYYVIKKINEIKHLTEEQCKELSLQKFGRYIDMTRMNNTSWQTIYVYFSMLEDTNKIIYHTAKNIKERYIFKQNM